MDALSQFAEWFPDIITPVLVERDEEKARRQEAVVRLQEAKASRQEAEARRQEAEARRQEAEVRRQEAEVRRQEAEVRRQEAEARLQEAKASRQEAEAKLQEVEALLHAERQSVRQRVCEKVQKKFQCEIPISLQKKLGRIDDHNALLNVFDRFEDADSLEVFVRFVDEEIVNLSRGNVAF